MSVGNTTVQLLRFAVNLIVSGVANGFGTFLFEDWLHFDSYMSSRILTAIIVAVAINYPMHKWWVFK
jgi:putative flippase GtrA